MFIIIYNRCLLIDFARLVLIGNIYITNTHAAKILHKFKLFLERLIFDDQRCNNKFLHVIESRSAFFVNYKLMLKYLETLKFYFLLKTN